MHCAYCLFDMIPDCMDIVVEGAAIQQVLG